MFEVGEILEFRFSIERKYIVSLMTAAVISDIGFYQANENLL